MLCLLLALAAGPRPLLVTVDDLPIMSAALATPAERRRATDGMLATLARHKIQAVGLVTYANVKSDADRGLLEAWLAAGHELGNHSFGHPSYTETEPAPYLADMERGRAALAELLAPHKRPLRFFRFPFLREGDTPEKLTQMRDYLARSGQRNLPVTIDDQDWSFEKPWITAQRAGDQAALARLREDYRAALRNAVEHFSALGDELAGRPVPQILLLHATQVGADLWDGLFTELAAQGFRFATADEVLADPLFRAPHAFVGRYGVSLWERLRAQSGFEQARDEVAALLAVQAEAWNRGDIDAFCAVYADDASFLSPSGLSQGRRAIAERYKKKYSTKEKMGALTLELLEARPLWGFEVTRFGDATVGRVHGVGAALRWTLAYPDRPAATGLSLLTVRRAGKTWLIEQDASM